MKIKDILGLNEEKASEDIVSLESFIFLDNEIKMFKYLPSIQKYELLMTTLAESKENAYFNNFKLDIFFHLNLILSYCFEIEFEEDDLADPYGLYDKFKRSGFLYEFLNALDESEYNELFNDLQALAGIIQESDNTIAGILSQIFKDTPDIIEKIQNAIKEINPETIVSLKDYLEEKRS